MKPIKVVPCILLVCFFITACKDSNEGLKVQPHDQNELMAIMHSMSTQMKSMQMTGDADHDFASMMSMHHQGAVTMGNKELEKGDDQVIRQMAQKMISMQQEEIQKLQAFLSSDTPASSPEGQAWGAEAMMAMDRMDRNSDLELLTGDADHDMAILMINHHQSAMDMAQSLSHHGHHDDIKKMATKMIEDQAKEIVDLQAWLLKNKNY